MGLMGTVLAALNTYNGGVRPLIVPRQLAIKAHPLAATMLYPDLSVLDGSGWSIASGQVQRIGPMGTVIYTIVPTEINASASIFLGFFPDYATGRLYLLAADASITTWFAFTTLSAKAITVRGTPGTRLLSSSYAFLHKLASGDFGYFASSSSSLISRCTITEASGATSAGASVTHGGVSVAGAYQFSTTIGNGSFYFSADETVHAGLNVEGLLISRGGRRGIIPQQMVPEFVAIQYTQIHLNGTSVMVSVANSGYGVCAPRNFARTDFDDFLNACADRIGLPK